MNALVFASLDIGRSIFTVMEESREAAEEILREAFDKYRELRPAYTWDDYKVTFHNMRVGEVMLDGMAFHMDPYNQKRWPDDYVVCAMSGDWFSPDDNPMASLVDGHWILDSAAHTPEEIAEALEVDVEQVYNDLGLEYEGELEQ